MTDIYCYSFVTYGTIVEVISVFVVHSLLHFPAVMIIRCYSVYHLAYLPPLAPPTAALAPRWRYSALATLLRQLQHRFAGSFTFGQPLPMQRALCWFYHSLSE
jgi:hypothetical protein